jgi:hypothetical protein
MFHRRTGGKTMRLLCVALGHKPDKTRIWNDNVDFRAPCRRCGTPMLRDVRKTWRAFDHDGDASPNRKLHRHDTSEGL